MAATAAAIGTAVMKALPPREHESSKRALVRLGGVGLTAAGLAGMGADSLETFRGKPGFHLTGVLAALATTGGAYALTKPGTATRGAMAPGQTVAHENVVREVSKPKALLSGMAVTGILFAVAKGESGGATVTFAEGGTFTYQCILVDPASGEKHTKLGMVGTFDVAAQGKSS